MTAFKFHSSFLAVFRLLFIHPHPLHPPNATVCHHLFLFLHLLTFAQSVKILFSVSSHIPGKLN